MRIFPSVVVLATVVGGLWTSGPALGQSPAPPFPDVPPWHWAYPAVLKDERAGLLVGYPATPTELVENSVTQVYEGFAHAQATSAQAWVERFTYNRPATWPRPLGRSQLVAFFLTDVRPVVIGDTATATFTARTTTRTAAGSVQTRTGRMQISLRRINGDWKIDYATLARGSGLFS